MQKEIKCHMKGNLALKLLIIDSKYLKSTLVICDQLSLGFLKNAIENKMPTEQSFFTK